MVAENTTHTVLKINYTRKQMNSQPRLKPKTKHKSSQKSTSQNKRIKKQLLISDRWHMHKK